MYTRKCRVEDFPTVLRLVNAACEADHTRRVLEEGFRQDFFSGPDGSPTDRGCVALTHDGTIAAFAWWEEHNDGDHDGDRHRLGMAVQGWVDPIYRGQGAGTALLRALERYAERSGADQVSITLRTYADIQESVALFERFGYEEARRYYKMSVELSGKAIEPTLETPPPTVTLDSFRPEDLSALVAADNRFFADHWGSRAVSIDEWQHRMITMRPHDPDLWVIAWARDQANETDQIVGECLCHASLHDGPGDGWIAIVGVGSEWRGCGVGRAMLATGLHRLQQAGFETASLHVDGDNVPALKLYRSLGMEIARTSLYFRKTIN